MFSGANWATRRWVKSQLPSRLRPFVLLFFLEGFPLKLKQTKKRRPFFPWLLRNRGVVHLPAALVGPPDSCVQGGEAGAEGGVDVGGVGFLGKATGLSSSSICLRILYIFPSWFQKEFITTGHIFSFFPGALTKWKSWNLHTPLLGLVYSIAQWCLFSLFFLGKSSPSNSTKKKRCPFSFPHGHWASQFNRHGSDRKPFFPFSDARVSGVPCK